MSPAARVTSSASAWTQLRELASDIKLSHSIFALPWDLLATFLAAGEWHRDARSQPHFPGQLALIVLCMVTARTVAMSVNRLLDAKLDATNPRTARRAIPAARLSMRFGWMTAGTCGCCFILATSLFGFAYQNWLPLILSAPVLLFISAYPLLKRFTGLCHFYLGACLALAPVCAWVAIAGNISLTPLIMAAAVLCWTAGFDIIYACQDYESDLRTGVFSVPARLGITGGLHVARATHLACITLLIALAVYVPQFQWLFALAIAIAGVLLLVEHLLVKPNDLSKVNLAFFTLNGVISLVIGALGVADIYL